MFGLSWSVFAVRESGIYAVCFLLLGRPTSEFNPPPCRTSMDFCAHPSFPLYGDQQPYLIEFDSRDNAKDVSEGERTEQALQSVRGKRLMYRTRLGI